MCQKKVVEGKGKVWAEREKGARVLGLLVAGRVWGARLQRRPGRGGAAGVFKDQLAVMHDPHTNASPPALDSERRPATPPLRIQHHLTDRNTPLTTPIYR